MPEIPPPNKASGLKHSQHHSWWTLSYSVHLHRYSHMQRRFDWLMASLEYVQWTMLADKSSISSCSLVRHFIYLHVGDIALKSESLKSSCDLFFFKFWNICNIIFQLSKKEFFDKVTLSNQDENNFLLFPVIKRHGDLAKIKDCHFQPSMPKTIFF